MKRDANKIHFGCLTFNMNGDGLYRCAPEYFEKLDDGRYRRIRRDQILKPYIEGTTEYLTASELYPLTGLNPNKRDTQIGEVIMKLYLLKYKFIYAKENSKRYINKRTK